MTSSQELEWELNDIFEGGIFAFPVDEPDVARSVVRYLLMRGVLAEEVADAIEQPGSIADLIAWLNGDERKSMIGVWATAWLNDARRRHDTDRRQQRRRRLADFRSAQEVVVVDRATDGGNVNGRRSPSPAGVEAVEPGNSRQMSLDSDFGGSEDSVFGNGSRKGSLEGVCGEGAGAIGSSIDHVTTDEDEIGSCALEPFHRSNSDDNVLTESVTVTSFPGSTFVAMRSQRQRSSRRPATYDDVMPDRPTSELYDSDHIVSGSAVFPVPVELSDSGNVSEVAAAATCRCCSDADNRSKTGSSTESVENNDRHRRGCCDDNDVVSTADKRRFHFRHRRPNTAGNARSSTRYGRCGEVACHCTLSHYAASASLQTVVFAVPPVDKDRMMMPDVASRIATW